MSFYVNLPSNSSGNYSSQNRIGNYRITLPFPLQFPPQEYEVCLSGITYINSIKVLTGKHEDNIIKILTNDIEDTITIPIKHYETIEQLIEIINETLHTIPYLKLKLTLEKEINRVKLVFDHQTEIIVSEKLSDILGFDGKTKFTQDFSKASDIIKTHDIAKFPPDMSGRKYHLFVYTDIIEPQIVGNTMVPMLRMINLKGKSGDAVTETFENPYYLRLNRCCIENISIVICDEFGEEVPFERGQVTVTLNFRKKQKN